MLHNFTDWKESKKETDGILIVNKPRGLTSHDIVSLIRNKLNIKKVGHAGTLDPLACGVLVILIGKATKLSKNLVKHDKVYEADCLLGIMTETDDLEGEIIKKQSKISIDEQDLITALSKFKGSIKQKVPRYSAVKLKGKRLYDLARKKKRFNLPERTVTIYEIELINFNPPEVKLRIRCSKGTYIRSICRDIGKVLGCGACLKSLKRSKSGPFTIDESISIDEIRMFSKNKIKEHILTIFDNEGLQRFIQDREN